MDRARLTSMLTAAGVETSIISGLTDTLLDAFNPEKVAAVAAAKSELETKNAALTKQVEDLTKENTSLKADKVDKAEYDSLKAENDKFKAEKTNAEYAKVLKELKADDTFTEFIISKVDKGKDINEFKTNATNYLKDNPKFVVAGIGKQSSNPKPSGNGEDAKEQPKTLAETVAKMYTKQK